MALLKVICWAIIFNKEFRLFSSLFGECDVHFWLKTNSAEVNLVYSSNFCNFGMFSAFKKFY